MSLIPAKCPECGGNINIDPSKKAGICEYCKQPFVVQEAIQNFNTTYNVTNNNDIKSDAVYIYENKSGVSNLLVRAQQCLMDKKFNESYGYYRQVLELDSRNGDAFIGLLLSTYKATSYDELVTNYLQSVEAKKETCPISKNNDYVHAMEYAKGDEKKKLKSVSDRIDIIIKEKLNKCDIEKKSIVDRIRKANEECRQYNEKIPEFKKQLEKINNKYTLRYAPSPEAWIFIIIPIIMIVIIHGIMGIGWIGTIVAVIGEWLTVGIVYVQGGDTGSSDYRRAERLSRKREKAIKKIMIQEPKNKDITVDAYRAYCNLTTNSIDDDISYLKGLVNSGHNC